MTVDWRKEWRDLYMEELPRNVHEARRDELIARARGAGQTDECLDGLSRSISYHEKLPHVGDPVDLDMAAAPTDDGFVVDPRGWVRMEASAESIARAKAEMGEDRGAIGHAGYVEGGEGWWGNVGEYGMKALAERRRPDVPVVHMGRLEEYDLLLGQEKADVKTRMVKARYLDDLDLLILDAHIRRSYDYFIFAVMTEENPTELIVVGWTTPARAREVGKFLPDGYKGHGAKDWLLRAHQLEPIATLLERLRP